MSRFFYDYEIIEHLRTQNDILTDKDREELKNMSEEEVPKFHEKFGNPIRSMYNLWNVKNPNCFEYKTEKMIKHPTEMSLEIVGRLWEKLNEEE